MKIKTIAGTLLLAALVTCSCSQGSTDEAKTKTKEAVKKVEPAKTTKAPEGKGVDKYGRKPGEAHYGHNHGAEGHGATGTQTNTNTNSNATPTEGGPDKFGRMPGDEHYGHGHP